MDVEAAFARGAQDRLRQDEPIGRDNRDIEVERREFSLRLFILQALRRADGQAMLFGPDLHRALLQFLAALRGAGGLAIPGHDDGPRRWERGECWALKGRACRSEEAREGKEVG